LELDAVSVAVAFAIVFEVLLLAAGFVVFAVAAENKNVARIIPQIPCIDLANSHKLILRLYALSSSTTSDPRDKLHDVKLAKKEIMLSVIHFKFLVEKKVPSFKIIMATADNIVAQMRIPLNKVSTTNHNTKRATDLRLEFQPGGVVAPDFWWLMLRAF